MKSTVGSATVLAAAILAFVGAASTAEACQGSSAQTILTRNQFRAQSKKRIPLSRLMSAMKAHTPPVAASASGQVPEPSINGLWSTGELMSDDTVVDTGFEMFSMGGTHVLNDPSPILEGNICLGVWTQVAPYTYVVNHPAYIYDDQGVNVTGTVSIYEKIVLDPGGDSFTESLKVVVRDLDGNALQTFDSQGVGLRVKAEDALK